jgi:hypothetical protein
VAGRRREIFLADFGEYEAEKDFVLAGFWELFLEAFKCAVGGLPIGAAYFVLSDVEGQGLAEGRIFFSSTLLEGFPKVPVSDAETGGQLIEGTEGAERAGIVAVVGEGKVEIANAGVIGGYFFQFGDEFVCVSEAGLYQNEFAPGVEQDDRGVPLDAVAAKSEFGLLIVAESGGRDSDGDADELADGVDDLWLGPDLLVHAPAGRAPIAPNVDHERTGLVASGLPDGVGEGLPVNGLSRGCDQGSCGGE